MKTCCFCGHGDAPHEVSQSLYEAINNLVIEHDVGLFYMGNHGNFDCFALGMVRNMQRRYPHIEYAVVLAYIPGEKKQDFSSTEETPTVYPEGLESVPKRYAITHRNRWMVNQSDFVIAYVNRGFGGAAQTLQYAKGKATIINLAD